jgi:glutamate-1-semialdehyde 2,1-aminomutase
MPFRRFFDRGAKREDPVAGDDTPTDEPEQFVGDEEQVDEAGSGEADDWADVDMAPEEASDIDWRARAIAVLPTGASTGSKRAEALYGSAEATGPTHYLQAAGCRVIDTAGNSFVDCTMALGAVALGYGEPTVRDAVFAAIANGNVAGLSDPREPVLAERLCDHIPCGEMAQFLKSGAEGMSAAVRIARTYTGRDLVIGSGYFGWHDWSSDSPGVPDAVQSLFRSLPFDDLDALDTAARTAGDRLAAIVIEPVVERLPSDVWIRKARELATLLGAVLVFDEMKTGFRLRRGGFQELSGITPDLAVFGKALANGFPLAAVVGRRDVMDAARRTWISSTLASESAGLAAALAVLEIHETAEVDVCATLAANGQAMRAGVSAAIEAADVDGVTVEGLDQMWFLRWDDPRRETRFLELAAQHGVLFKRGAYNYAATAHDETAIVEIESAASAALVDLREEERNKA